MVSDLKIIETGNGGDAVIAGNDLAFAGINNMPYLSCFSGDGNWWGNTLLMPNQPEIHFKSETEGTLQAVALNNSGRIRIVQAISADLNFIKTAVPGTTVSVTARIISDDRIEMSVDVEGQTLYFLWDAELGQLYPGYTSPDFISTEIPGFILTENGINYFIPE